jgi:hypothetical protein
MGKILGSGPKPPPTPQPQAMPEVGIETSDAAIRRQRRKSGFEATLMGGGSLTPKTGLKTVLGA